MQLSFERGNFSRVWVGVAATLFFLISAILEPANRKNMLFFVGIGLILTWQQYSLYLMKKQEDQRPE